MLGGLLALTLATAFCSAALYINIAEHPARMLLDDEHALAQWAPSYDRAFTYQGGLAVLSGAAGLAQVWVSGDWRWSIGAALILANWPYTMLVILPLNHRLKAIAPAAAGSQSRAMLAQWNQLHAFRTALSGMAALAFLWCAAGK